MPTIQSCSLIERCLARGHDAPPSPVCVVASPRPAFPSLGGSGSYASRALPDLCLGIGSGRLGHLDPWTCSFKGHLESPGSSPGAFLFMGSCHHFATQ